MAPEDVAKIVSLDEPPLGTDELDAVVTLAYLALIADGFANDTELGVFFAMVARLRALATRAVKQSEYRSATSVGQPRELDEDESEALLARVTATIGERDPGEIMTSAPDCDARRRGRVNRRCDAQRRGAHEIAAKIGFRGWSRSCERRRHVETTPRVGARRHGDRRGLPGMQRAE